MPPFKDDIVKWDSSTAAMHNEDDVEDGLDEGDDEIRMRNGIAVPRGMLQTYVNNEAAKAVRRLVRQLRNDVQDEIIPIAQSMGILPRQGAEEVYHLEVRHSCLWARITDMNYDPRLQSNGETKRYNKYMADEIFVRMQRGYSGVKAAKVEDLYGHSLRVVVLDRAGIEQRRSFQGKKVKVSILKAELDADGNVIDDGDFEGRRVLSTGREPLLYQDTFEFDENGIVNMRPLFVREASKESKWTVGIEAVDFEAKSVITEPFQVKCQRAFTNRKKEFPLLTDYVSVLENIGDRANTALEQMEIYQVHDLLENLAHNYEKVKKALMAAGFNDVKWNVTVDNAKRAMQTPLRIWSPDKGAGIQFNSENYPLSFFHRGVWINLVGGTLDAEQREIFRTQLRKAYTDWFNNKSNWYPLTDDQVQSIVFREGQGLDPSGEEPRPNTKKRPRGARLRPVTSKNDGAAEGLDPSNNESDRASPQYPPRSSLSVMPSLATIGLSDPDRSHRGDDIVRLTNKLINPLGPDTAAIGGAESSQLPRAPSSLTMFARSEIPQMFSRGESGDGSRTAELLLRHPSIDIDFGGDNFESIIGGFNHTDSGVPTRFSPMSSTAPENDTLGDGDRAAENNLPRGPQVDHLPRDMSGDGFDFNSMNMLSDPNYEKTQLMMVDAYVKDYVPMISRSIDPQEMGFDRKRKGDESEDDHRSVRPKM